MVVPQLVPPSLVATALSLLPGGRTGLVAVPLGTSPALDALAGDDRLVSTAAELLAADGAAVEGAGAAGAAVACFGITFIVKAPGAADVALWHQDGEPWQRGLGISEAVTLWVALDPVGPGSGGLAVIPGSHTLAAQALGPGVAPGAEGGPGWGGLFGGGIDPRLVDETRAVYLTMAPGDVSAHHPRLIHGSPANTSPSGRRALVVRYRPA